VREHGSVRACPQQVVSEQVHATRFSETSVVVNTTRGSRKNWSRSRMDSLGTER
jgi:hypothetical protein